MFQSTLPCGERQPRASVFTFSRQVSIHAPVWGATCRYVTRHTKTTCFNPRSRVGSDAESMEIGVYHVYVSIHAPVWGATALIPADLDGYTVSIHAPVWGATNLSGDALASDFVSIHAPVWGATVLPLCFAGDFLVSIHAPVWGATRDALACFRVGRVSIHAPEEVTGEAKRQDGRSPHGSVD